MQDRSAVLLFIKSPEKGKVKSRLAKAIGENTALDIYKCLVDDTLETLKNGKYLFRLCFYPPGSDAIVKNWLGSTYSYAPQYGEDIGERMKYAFIQAFSDGMEKVLIIGSDIPQLSISLLTEALDALDTNDAVIGPAHDGGYYLIGFNRDAFMPEIFQGIAWSTDSVYYQTMNVFDKAGRRVHVLAGLTDVDTFEDLLKLFAENSDADIRESLTMSFMRYNKHKIFTGSLNAKL
jgi:rSAM/selenodomain-associated transferase 1